jgi:hypothetical protein
MSKKKLFISCPMAGRSEENIRKTREKMHKIAEIVFEEELEVIDSYVPEYMTDKAKNKPVCYLGACIQKMSEADCYIGVYGKNDLRGCGVENKIAREYHLRRTFVNTFDVAPDIHEQLVNLLPGDER